MSSFELRVRTKSTWLEIEIFCLYERMSSASDLFRAIRVAEDSISSIYCVTRKRGVPELRHPNGVRAEAITRMVVSSYNVPVFITRTLLSSSRESSYGTCRETASGELC